MKKIVTLALILMVLVSFAAFATGGQEEEMVGGEEEQV
jgi:hypothetical protein